MSRAAEAARTVARALGQTLITAGVVILLFVGYELYFTNLYTDNQQAALGDRLRQQWALPHSPTGGASGGQSVALPQPAIGEGLAVLRIPRLGRDYAKVIVEGVATEDLKRGPGHYPSTAMPGEIGNFVVSGHRTTYGAPFNRLDEVQPGDAVVVETRDTWFTYRVDGEQVVDPTAIEVTYPVPGQAGATPTKALLTFTTCNPKYSARQRLVLRGTLAERRAKTDGMPAALLAAAAG